MAVSNSISSLKECVRKKVIGCVQNEFDGGHNGAYTFLFDDGTGFTFTTRGTFWIESADEVKRVKEKIEQKSHQFG